jgi:predicted SAM-dependent methyltransferase
LHIGCGPHHLYGWLNTDVVTSNDALYLDATQPLPFPENTFSFIFSEHMLEHIPIDAAQVFMQECNRVLKPGGVLRLATPDMAFLFALWEGKDPSTSARYFSNAARHFVKYPRLANKCTTINNFFYNWGHCFIYDQETITHVMRLSNFQRIQRVEVGESDNTALQRLERHGLSISDEFNKLETMVMEGTKPNKSE